jgi:hypothetical protein
MSRRPGASPPPLIDRIAYGLCALGVAFVAALSVLTGGTP